MDKELIEFLSTKFDRIDQRFEEVHREIKDVRGEMKQGLDAVNHRIDDLDTRVAQGFADVNQRIDTLTHTVEALNERDLQDSNVFAKDIANLQTRVSKLEAK